MRHASATAEEFIVTRNLLILPVPLEEIDSIHYRLQRAGIQATAVQETDGSAYLELSLDADRGRVLDLVNADPLQ